MAVKTGRLVEEWSAQHPKAAELYKRALKVFPSGVTHDNRYIEPYPIYVTRAAGTHKWDVDGHEYVDYTMGHGALLLGHSHPVVTAAVAEQLQKGTHYGGCHELEVRWGELVQETVPSAEKVHFFSSGTEATAMAMRLARAYTGRDKVMKIQGHFHGWHDQATIAMSPPYDEPSSVGIPTAVGSTVVGVPANDIEAMRAAFDRHRDIAGVILIADGAGHDYLQAVNELAHERGAITIYDEVVTGFRFAPGGCQEYYGVTPDMTTLAKILAGGLPGGAVGAKADIINLIEFRKDPKWLRFGRIPHPGTFNANPLSAAAGVACLEIVKTGEPQKKATANADKIRAGMNEVLKRRGVEGKAGGEVSQLGVRIANPKVSPRELLFKVRMAFQLAGVDSFGLGMLVSAVHTDADIARTVEAFDSVVETLQAEGAV